MTPSKRLAQYGWAIFALPVVLGVCLSGAATQSDDKPLSEKEKLTFYKQQVQPILRAKCWKCHGDKGKPKGGLRLTSRESTLEGGDTEEAVLLDNPEESLLLLAINYEDLEMPPTGKLPQKQIDILTRWVKLGLPFSPDTSRPKLDRNDEEAKNFWSFQQVQRPRPPQVKQQSWVRNPIDAFVLARLEAAGLTPAPQAEKVALLRRAYYDLTGLPPSPAEVRAFLQDDSPHAFEHVVDRLLDSPHYGERWARHWLDLVRYAETNSFERDGAKPFVWRYRDYVIEALNADKPYDQFIREQLAGDELPGATPETLIATGYYRLCQWDDEPSDPLLAMYDEFDDILTTTSQVLLGLTMNCARCHDHKMDPIEQSDYYRLVAFFRNVRHYGVRSGDSVAKASLRPLVPEVERQRHERIVTEHREKLAAVNKQILAIEKIVRKDFAEVEKEDFKHEMNRIPIVKKRVPDLLSKEKFDEYVAAIGQRKKLQAFRPPMLAQALCVTEPGPDVPPTFVLQRGNPQSPGDKVQPGFPAVLTSDKPQIEKPAHGRSSGRRLALANWIAGPDNPLTARVMVNRIWQHHFGRGIVRSPNNFGLHGVAPTHPQLLDWLASEFVAGGWKLKTLHKLIMTSATYQMSSASVAQALESHPTNDLFWRFNMRRLAAEEVRDSILAVNGSLNREKMGGPSIYPIIPAEVLAGQSQPGAGWGNSSAEDRNRRSIYIHIKRSLSVPILAGFDAADTDMTCPVRFSTTQPTQALGMLNGRFLNRQAQVFADYVQQRAGADPAAQIKLALWRTVQRPPTKAEIERGLKFMQTMQDDHQADAKQALKLFCLLVLNLNEFMYLD